MEIRTPNLVRRISDRLGLGRDWYLILLAAAIGVIMGGVATAFIMPLRWIERWAEHREGITIGMILLVLLAPAIGGILAGVVQHLIPAAGRGPGVSAVLYAVHRQKSRLPLRMAARKWIASTLTIGSGGSAGAEGPIVTIGATIGSTFGRWLRISPANTATLLGCGAAAGISSIFNAPIAGIFFCLEVLLRDFSLRTFTPIVIASVISAVWTQTMLGAFGDTGGLEALFPVTQEFFKTGEFVTLLEMPNYLVLGIACGIVAPMFVRMMFLSDDLFRRVRVHPIIRPGVGGALLGLIGVAWIVIVEPANILPPFFGNGYPVIGHLLDPSTYFADVHDRVLHPVGGVILILLAITVLKALSTCLTIGSGGVGGLFAPSLLLGAGLGGAVGMLFYTLDIFPALNPAHYALVGMACMLAGTTHAPLTAIIMVYEITRSEEIVLPLMFAAVITTIVARLIESDSVYTWKLSQLGVRLGQMSDLTILRRMAVGDIPLAEAVVVHPNESAQRLLDLSERHTADDYIVAEEDGSYLGMVVGADLRMAMLEREAVPLLLVADLQRDDLPTVTPDETLDVVLDKFSRHDVHSLAVLHAGDEHRVLGMITRDRLMRAYQEALSES